MSPVFLVDAFTVKVSSFAALPVPLVTTSWVSLDDFTVPLVVWLAAAGAFSCLAAGAAADFFAGAGAPVEPAGADAAAGPANATARTAAVVTLNMYCLLVARCALPALHPSQVRRA